MNKQTKKWFGIAAVLVVIGLVMFTAVMTVNHWDFTKLSTVDYETNTYQVSEEFSNISVNTETADIRFELSDDGTCRVVCYEAADEKHSVSVLDDTLTINGINERKWYKHIGIWPGMPKITVYLPEKVYSALAIDANVGDILVDGVSANLLDLSVSTGRTEISNVKCNSVISSGSTGDVSLKNVIATEKLSVERSTGDVKLEDCDGGEIFIETSTGDVSGSLLSEKVFIARTDIGSIDVPETTTGGKCEISTDTGDIRIKIQ